MLHKRSIKEKLFKGGAWAFLGKVLTVVLGLGINMLLARLLTPEEMGAYFLLFSLVGFFTIIGQMGTSQVVLRKVAALLGTECESSLPPLIRFVLVIVLLCSSFLAITISSTFGHHFVNQLFHSEVVNYTLSTASLLIVVMALQSLLAEIHRGFHDIRMATIFGGLATSVLTLSLLLMVWFTLSQFDLKKAMLITLSAAGLSLLVSLVMMLKKLSRISSASKKVDYTMLLSSSYPLLMYGLLYYVLNQSPLLLVGALADSESAALYGAASRLVLLVTMPLLIVNAVIPPIISELYSQGKITKLEDTLRMSSTIAGLPAIVVLMVFMFFSESILGLVYGGFYKQAWFILVLLSIGQLVNVWAGSCALTLVHTGHAEPLTKITLLCAGLTVALGIVMTQYWAAAGMAVAASLGMALQNILILYVVKKKTNMWTHVNFSYISSLWRRQNGIKK